MSDFVFLTLLLFLSIGFRSILINNTVQPENRVVVSKIYSASTMALYLTFLFSEGFYLTTYFGWIATIILVAGYLESYL